MSPSDQKKKKKKMLICITYLKSENPGANGCHTLLTEFVCDALGNKVSVLFYLYDPFPFLTMLQIES